jgi:hypothetical protein
MAFHNFALQAGVFVHNCGMAARQECLDHAQGRGVGKDIDAVMRAQADLADIAHALKQVVGVKGRGLYSLAAGENPAPAPQAPPGSAPRAAANRKLQILRHYYDCAGRCVP